MKRIRSMPLRGLAGALAAAVCLTGAFFHTPAALAATTPFTLENVEQAARELAAVPFQAPPPIPEALRNLDYDAWRKIRFRPDHAFWAKSASPYQLQFFHPGFLYDRTVKLHVVDGNTVVSLPVTKDMFDYSQVKELPEKLPAEIGAAGFRVHTAINTKAYLDEFVVFLGASYFRAVAKGQVYGLSARGLAINTAEAVGEEFPWFREFWIVKPTPGNAAKGLTVYALLDSPSLAGAFAFTIMPGRETVMDVASRIYLRTPVKKLGIAPLTSMFLYGENSLPSAAWTGGPRCMISTACCSISQAANGSDDRPRIPPISWSAVLKRMPSKASGCSIATRISTATRIPRPATRSARAFGSSRAATGERGGWRWC